MDEVNEFLDDWDESTTLDCPNCGEQVYEDAEQCPLCQPSMHSSLVETIERQIMLFCFILL